MFEEVIDGETSYAVPVEVDGVHKAKAGEGQLEELTKHEVEFYGPNELNGRDPDFLLIE